MNQHPSRRRFLKSSAAAGLALWTAPAAIRAAGANEKLNIGVIGVTNRGGANLAGVSGENIVALCDVDDRLLGPVAAKYPGATKFNDFRKMIQETKSLDAVVVSTADHCHANATVMALRMGKHVYCEKPLTHTVAESRLVAAEAAKAKTATQLGTQIHATDNYRRVVEMIQSGMIGTVNRAHVFVNSNYGLSKITDAGADIPAGFHWDLWLGPANERPYQPIYHPQQWRHFWDFGGGTLGDFGCHHLDLSFWALGIRQPTSIEAHGPAPDPDRPPNELTVDYMFPARAAQPAVHITWYQGAKRPAIFDEVAAPKNWGNGTLFVGDKGMILANYGKLLLLPAEQFKSSTPPPKTIAPSIGHHAEWIKACKEGTPTLCNFAYASALTETVNLGNVAHRAGNKKLDWDAANLTVTNVPQANAYLRREYRKGWEL
jgi:predicted dehydrogenase